MLNPGSLQIGGNKIPWSTSVKYLGITLNNSLNDAAEMNIQLRSFYARSNEVLRILYKCSTRVKLVLFQAYCSNFYLSYLWFSFPMYSFKRCCVGYNNVIRTILCLPKYFSASEMLVYNRLDDFSAKLRKVVAQFYIRLVKIDNSFIKSFMSSDDWYSF